MVLLAINVIGLAKGAAAGLRNPDPSRDGLNVLD
jgi:hypothetical protein